MWFRGTLASSSAWVRPEVVRRGRRPRLRQPHRPHHVLAARTSSASGASARRSRSCATTTTGTPSVKPLVGAIEFVGAPDPIALSAALQSRRHRRVLRIRQHPDAQRAEATIPNVTVTERRGLPVRRPAAGAARGFATRRRPGAPGALESDRPPGLHRHGARRRRPAVPKSYAAPGTWGYARDVFEAGYDSAPRTRRRTSKRPAQLVADAGAEGGSFTIGLIGEVPPPRRRGRPVPESRRRHRPVGGDQDLSRPTSTSRSSSTRPPGPTSTPGSPSPTATPADPGTVLSATP